MKKIIKLTILILIIGLTLHRPDFAWGGYEDEINEEIQNLNNKISSSKKKIEDIQSKQKEYVNLISSKQAEKATLSNEISILNDRLAKAQLDIESTELEIDKTNLEIKKISIDIQNKDDEITKEKEHIATLLRLMYKQDQVSTLEILLLNNSLADFINQVQYLENTNEEISNSVENLKVAKEKLEEGKKVLTSKQEELNSLRKTLEDKKLALEKEQDTKGYLLEETKQSERQYQFLLEQARREQAQASAEISSLEKSVRQKLAELKNKPTLNYTGFIWPVTQHYITASFHDPDYPYRRLIGEHPAVDIKAAQGSTLRAAADGYVAKVKFDGSKKYGYIMIIHGDGLSTVYGHVSGVSIKTDDFVIQGQVIGKTGGLPGTPGSGPFSTGPHLHFEIRKDGIPVNPANYLP